MATAQIQRADRTFGRVVSLKNFAPPNGGNHSKQGSADPWADFSNIFRSRDQPLSQSGLQSGWGAIFGPLRQGKVDDLVVVGQIGQSLDGRIATESGHSKYINGPAGLAHLHRLRSLVDGIVIGVGTAIADDPQLTVRRVSGSHPTRVVIDPKGRLGSDAKVFAADGTRRLLIVAQGTRCAPPPGVETIALPASGGQIAPAAILAALAGHGLRRVLIEGGAVTVSRFLAAGCLDRLHVMVAPVILGAGHASFSLPPVERADQALRIPTHVHQIEDEVLYDCDLAAQRVPVGAAKTST
jgi:diaminohydroxyphosphoribosylaminopyrimidine deaminase/5-amino-6-(5-phosphoribosylamino)uracil reductase